MTAGAGRRVSPRRSTLATRIALASLLVAVVACTVTALASARLVGQATREATRDALAVQADVLTAVPDVDAVVGSLGPELADAGIAVVTVAPDGSLSGPAAAVTAARLAGLEAGPRDLSRLVLVGRTTIVVEARVLDGGGIALVREYQPALRSRVTRATAVGALIGLVGAALAGAVLARVVSGPLRRTAAVAHDMRAGHRDLRVAVSGPAEVAEVGEAVNALAASLATSEGRQRAFLHSVSHELRTPLTAVTGFAESVADGVVEGDDARRAGATILAEAHRLERLVDDLLDLARLGADSFRLDVASVDLTALVEEAAAVWARRAGDVPVAVSAAPGVRLRTDPVRLRQVIDLLADNALRVTPPGRPLVVELGHAAGGGARIEVRDGGPGLAPEDYAVAFEPGVLHSRYGAARAGSSGIGLSLVAALVGRLGGTVVAGPAAEGGAAFRVDLPAAPHAGP